jgi:non-specific serine/threonine protein kinase
MKSIQSISLLLAENGPWMTDGESGTESTAAVHTLGNIVKDAAASHGGTLESATDERFILTFGSTVHAILAAVEIQRACVATSSRAQPFARTRLVVHTYEVRGAHLDMFSIAVHLATRIVALARRGQILVSELTADQIAQLSSDISFLELGTHRLRDIVRPVRLSQVVAQGIVQSFPALECIPDETAYLPVAATSFVGREQQLQDLVKLMTTSRLVTLTGAGGSGKTRLALELARTAQAAHREGVRFVELAGVRTDELVPGAVVAALGMRDPTSGRLPTEFLCASLASGDPLLVLDNCEHIVSGVAGLVAELLRACPNLQVLATSREPLRLASEVEQRVPPLERPDAATSLVSPDRLADYEAVRLLVARARDVQPGFQLSGDNAAAVARICARLEGLPLGIELAAARLRTLSPDQVAARLGAQLDLLISGGGSRPDRQHTMRATIDWSHELLSPVEQVVFRRLSVFAGGFTAAAAGYVSAGDDVLELDVPDALDGLVIKSLIEVDHERAEPRLRILEPLRQYAAERLHGSPDRDDVVRRHVEWAVQFAGKAAEGYVPEQPRWSLRLAEERDNLRQALEVALTGTDRAAALWITGTLGYAWFTTGEAEALGWTMRALRATTDDKGEARGWALFAAGFLESNVLNYRQALAYLTEGLNLFRALENHAGEAYVLMALGRVARSIDIDETPASAFFEQGRDIFREFDLPGRSGYGPMLAFLAIESYQKGNYELAASLSAEALEFGAARGVVQLVAECRRMHAVFAARSGRHAEAQRLLEQAATAHEQAGDRWQLAQVLSTAAHLTLERGDERGAVEPAGAALRIAREIGSGERMIDALQTALRVLWRCGRSTEAATLLGATEATCDPLPRRASRYESRLAPVVEGVRTQGLDAHRAEGRGVSLDGAAHLALRTLNEEFMRRTSTGQGHVDRDTAPMQTTTQPAGADASVFRCEGEYWTVSYAGKMFRLRGNKGLFYIARLLADPGRDVHVADLAACGGGRPTTGNDRRRPVEGDLGAILDPRATAQFKERLSELRVELDDATSASDLGRAERAQHEIEAITQELSAAYGLRGRARKVGDPSERVRKAVTNQIRRALEKINAEHPELGRHLTNALRTGFACAYQPEHPVDWCL